MQLFLLLLVFLEGLIRILQFLIGYLQEIAVYINFCITIIFLESKY